ncbi:hypothetical protein B0H13DRAFT_1858807 [Mycena leptocephala]|nr:hypothetical protein B0H13DRAFT_1858807 [Mycena leptocephala]
MPKWESAGEEESRQARHLRMTPTKPSKRSATSCGVHASLVPGMRKPVHMPLSAYAPHDSRHNDATGRRPCICDWVCTRRSMECLRPLTRARLLESKGRAVLRERGDNDPDFPRTTRRARSLKVS